MVHADTYIRSHTMALKKESGRERAMSMSFENAYNKFYIIMISLIDDYVQQWRQIDATNTGT